MSKTESGIYSVSLKIQVDERQRQQWVYTSLHAYFKFVAHGQSWLFFGVRFIPTKVDTLTLKFNEVNLQ